MRRLLLLAALQCAALAALTAPAVVGLSARVGRMVDDSAAPGTLAGIAAAGGAAAMIANPLFGWLSDRTRGRRWWLMAGAIGGLAGSAALMLAPGPTGLAVAWAFTQVAYNACFGALNGLVSEGLEAADRNRASALFSAASFVGTLPGLAIAALLPGSDAALFLAVPLLTVVVVFAAAPFVREPAPRAAGQGAGRWVGIRELRSRAFVSVLLVRLVISVELTAGLVFGLYLFMSRWSLAEPDAVRLVSLSTLVGAVGIVVGSLSIAVTPLHRWDARLLLVIAVVALGAAMLARGLTESVAVFVIATAMAGVAIGFGMTATRSLTHAALPPSRSALGLGLLGVANSLGGVVAPPVAGALLGAGGALGLIDDYAGMYVLLALPVLGALALVPRMRARRIAGAADTDEEGVRVP